MFDMAAYINNEGCADPTDYLPTEIFQEGILDQLSITDLCVCMYVSKAWQARANSEILWNRKCKTSSLSEVIYALSRIRRLDIEEIIFPTSVVQVEPFLGPPAVLASSEIWRVDINKDFSITIHNQTTKSKHTLAGHKGIIYQAELLEKTLITSSEDHTLRIWDITQEKLIRTIETKILVKSFSVYYNIIVAITEEDQQEHQWRFICSKESPSTPPSQQQENTETSCAPTSCHQGI